MCEQKNIKTIKKFKDAYNKAETLGEGWDLVESLSGEELLKLRDSLEIIDEYFGMDMRKEYFLRSIKNEIDQRAKYSTSPEAIKKETSKILKTLPTTPKSKGVE